jgi:hypothetical protein
MATLAGWYVVPYSRIGCILIRVEKRSPLVILRLKYILLPLPFPLKCLFCSTFVIAVAVTGCPHARVQFDESGPQDKKNEPIDINAALIRSPYRYADVIRTRIHSLIYRIHTYRHAYKHTSMYTHTHTRASIHT